MATIVPNQTFKHGRETYEAGESYEVSQADAEYFQEAKWIGDSAALALIKSQLQILDIQDVTLGHEARVN